MKTIEIDFDVYKALIIRRETEEETFNDVLRELLGLAPARTPKQASTAVTVSHPWVSKGVSFTHGTEFRATYKGQVYTGKVENGALVVSGERFNSPSAAAVSITKTPVNGWRFWECKQPGQQGWIMITSLRKN